MFGTQTAAAQRYLGQATNLGVAIVQADQQGFLADLFGRADGKDGGAAHLDAGVAQQTGDLIEAAHLVRSTRTARRRTAVASEAQTGQGRRPHHQQRRFGIRQRQQHRRQVEHRRLQVGIAGRLLGSRGGIGELVSGMTSSAFIQPATAVSTCPCRAAGKRGCTRPSRASSTAGVSSPRACWRTR